jgi:TolA-binding protein
MKKLLTLIILLTVCSTGFAWPWNGKPLSGPVNKPKQQSVVVPTTPSQNPVNDARAIVRELNIELKAAKNENSKLEKSLSQTRLDLDQSFKEIDVLNKEIKTLKEWGIVQQSEAQKFTEKYNNSVKRYHRLKLIAAIVAAAGGIFLGLQFMAFAPPPYNLLIPVGSAGLFGSLIWMFF